MGLNQAQNVVFHHFVEFELQVFLEIGKCEVKPTKKFEGQGGEVGGCKFGSSKPKFGPKLGLLPFS